MLPPIYEYKDAVNFLHDTLKLKKIINPQYSIVAWSKKMGFSHPSSLDHIIQRRRKIKPNTLDKIYKGLNFSEDEKKYFHELVLCQNAVIPSEIEKHQAKIDKMSEYYRGRILEEDNFKIISDWYNFAICSMTLLKEFRYDPTMARTMYSFIMMPGAMLKKLRRTPGTPAGLTGSGPFVMGSRSR